MTPALVMTVGPALALIIALALRPRESPQAPPPADPVRRELADLREQLRSGEIDEAEHRELRERLAVRLAAAESRRAPEAARGGWHWPAAGLLATLVIVITLVPALRERGVADSVTGNDAIAGSATAPGLAEWQSAERALRSGDEARALRHYRLAVAFAPEHPSLRARFGLALAQAGRRQEALSQLRLAVRQEPRLASARVYLGAVLLASGRRGAARQQWRRVVALEPGGPMGRLARELLGQQRSLVGAAPTR